MDAKAIIEQANEQHAARNYEEAIALYQEGLAMVESDVAYHSFHLVVGDMQTELGQHEEAVVSYKKVLASFPDHPDAIAGLASAEKTLNIATAPSSKGFFAKLFGR